MPDAVAPLTQANDIVATEEDAESSGGVDVPINIAINADRLDFEKIGLKVTSNDPALTGGVFNVSVTDDGGAVIEDIEFDFDSAAGGWVLFKDMDAQLDFDTVKFKAPANYAGDSTLTVTPFAQTGTDKVEAAPLELAMQIVASAEALTLAAQTPLPLVLTEAGAKLCARLQCETGPAKPARCDDPRWRRCGRGRAPNLRCNRS